MEVYVSNCRDHFSLSAATDAGIIYPSLKDASKICSVNVNCIRESQALYGLGILSRTYSPNLSSGT